MPTEITEVSREDGTIVSLPLPADQFENFADYKEPLLEDASESLLPSPTAHMLNSTFRWDAHAQVNPFFCKFEFKFYKKVNGKQAYSANLDTDRKAFIIFSISRRILKPFL